MSLRNKLLLVVQIILFVNTTIVLIFIFDAVRHPNTLMSFTKAEEKLPNKTIVILLYTNFFKGPWYLRWNKHFHCKYHCEFTYKKSELARADAVAFHDADMPQVLPTRPTASQIWIYFNLESPVNSKAKDYQSVFNWTMSYRSDADIYAPYGDFTPLDCEERRRAERLYKGRDFSRNKTKVVAWLGSNCRNTFGRLSYIKLLSKYVKVDIFGKCGKLVCPSDEYSLQSPECREQLKQYKFYLAFENSYCQDYITEKYWQVALENDLVPIVMGGGDYNKTAVPGSFINVDDFQTVKDLSDYLLYLDSHPKAYNAFFKWKTLYQLDMPYLYGCTMCTALQSRPPNTMIKIIPSLHEYWKEGKCWRGKNVME